jgi:hypothetical protein
MAVFLIVAKGNAREKLNIALRRRVSCGGKHPAREQSLRR